MWGSFFYLEKREGMGERGGGGHHGGPVWGGPRPAGDRPTGLVRVRLAPAIVSKASSTLNIEDHALQQRPLNDSLNLEDAAGFSIYRVSLNGSLFI
jgi:hypothetical protein